MEKEKITEDKKNDVFISCNIENDGVNAIITFEPKFYDANDKIIVQNNDRDFYKTYLEITDPDMLIKEKEAEEKGMEYNEYKNDILERPDKYKKYFDFMCYNNKNNPNFSGFKLSSLQFLTGVAMVNQENIKTTKIDKPIKFAIPLSEFYGRDYERISYAIKKGNSLVARSIILTNDSYSYYYEKAVKKIKFNKVKYYIDNNDMDSAKELIRDANSSNEVVDDNGYNPLHYAIMTNNFEMVKALVEANLRYIRVNSKCKLNKYSSLMLAIENENYEIAEFLIENGANIEYKFGSGTIGNLHSPIYSAILKENLEIIGLLLEKNKDILYLEDGLKMLPIHYAAANGKEKVVDYFCSLNNFDGLYQEVEGNGCFSGYNALHFAVESGNKKIVEILISNNFNLDSRNSLGQTPLFMVARHKRSDITEFLIKNGASLNIQDNKGKTVLTEAICHQNIDLIRFLFNDYEIKINDIDIKEAEEKLNGELANFLKLKKLSQDGKEQKMEKDFN